MKLLGILVCIIIFSGICAAEETEYFDWKGSQLYAAKNYTDALAYFNQALAQDPNYANAWVHKGDTERVLNDINVSIQSYYNALQLDGNNAAAWSGIADSYTALKSYSNASIAASKATELDNKSAYYWYREGYLLQKLEMYEESLAKYDGAIALYPNYKEALYMKGISQIALSKYDDAEALFDQA
ncbi:MAG: tetratricopeptide repeat protein, partial [Methanothrix sp.]